MKYDKDRLDKLIKDIIAITPKERISFENLIFPHAVKILLMEFVMDTDDDINQIEKLKELSDIYKNLNDAIDKNAKK